MTLNKLVDWDYSAIKLLCDVGKSESEKHDFKMNLPDTVSLTKLCCAFANASGGFIIFGVKDLGRKGFNILGIDRDKELYGKFIAKLKSDPAMDIAPPRMIDIPDSSQVLYVFEILRSNRAPHLPSTADHRIFWKRHGSDCIQMTLEEIRYQMLNYQEKREKLALLLMDFNNKIMSLKIQGSLLGGEYNGDLFSFDIIDQVIVETFIILKDEHHFFKRLERIRSVLMMINIKKQRMIHEQLRDSDLLKLQFITDYKDFVQRSIPEIVEITAEVETLFKVKFDVENPYKG